jgi:hypothetical protein
MNSEEAVRFVSRALKRLGAPANRRGNIQAVSDAQEAASRRLIEERKKDPAEMGSRRGS